MDANKVSDQKTITPPKQNSLNYQVKFTFYLTYVLLITTGTITFIEALRTNDKVVRHIMNL